MQPTLFNRISVGNRVIRIRKSLQFCNFLSPFCLRLMKIFSFFFNSASDVCYMKQKIVPSHLNGIHFSVSRVKLREMKLRDRNFHPLIWDDFILSPEKKIVLVKKRKTCRSYLTESGEREIANRKKKRVTQFSEVLEENWILEFPQINFLPFHHS